MTFTPEQFVDECRKWRGTAFHHQGRKIMVGVDCMGLVVESLKTLGHPIRDRRDYPRTAHDDLMLRLMREEFDEIPLEDARPGAVLIFWYSRRSIVQHGAVYTCDEGRHRRVLHAHATIGGGQVVEQRLDKFWTKRLGWAFVPRGMRW